jgi:hypothetical protein
MKLNALLLMLALSTQMITKAQNVAVKPNNNKEAAVAPAATNANTHAPLTLKELNQEFILRAKMRIADNEKSLVVLKGTQNIQDKQERAFYNEKVALFETRNNEMNNKMYAFNVVSGTNVQFAEFKKRWHWAMDELSIYEKNLMTENYLNK